VAEDLGVVPDYVRPNLLKLGIPGFKIPYWERNPDYTYTDGAKYPRLSIVTPATHDHDPLVTLWKQKWQAHEDARARQDHHNAYVTWLELQRFVKWAGLDENNVPREFTRELHEAFSRQVLASNAWLAIFMITDIFAQPQRFNVPGLFTDGNWSCRLDKPVREWDENPLLQNKVQMFERLFQTTAR
jgi:4-alpha-glucanotransferase